jgi:hypothetical protein
MHDAPNLRNRGRHWLRNSFEVAIIANANTIVGLGKRCFFQFSGVVGSPSSRLENTPIF